jgi:hypothetical protein
MNHVKAKFLSALMISALFPLALMLPACETDRSERIEETGPSFDLHPTAKEVYAGEIVTVTTETHNLLGRDAKVKWATTGGELKTEDEGRIARVKFDRPGTYVVSAQLYSDDEMVQTQSVTINVRPLR